MITGKQIRALRRARGLTQEQLGELMGAHRTTVVRWESVGLAGRDEIAVRTILEHDTKDREE